ncbi:MAG: response regulator [Acidobacteria bacterium]|nr:response regulator [Acidobacteriota bacterium]
MHPGKLPLPARKTDAFSAIAHRRRPRVSLSGPAQEADGRVRSVGAFNRRRRRGGSGFALRGGNAHLALPDLILLDWNLPKVNGCEVLRRLTEDRKLRCIPVLVFSTSTPEKDIRDVYGSPANGDILKLGSVDMLTKIVESVADFWVIVAMLLKVRRDAPAQRKRSGPEPA